MLLSEIEALAPLARVPALIPALPRSPCAGCHFRALNICGALLERSGVSPALQAKHRTIAARRNIYRAGEGSEGVLVICDGWAVRFVQLPNGRRQILSIVLPGDLVSPSALLERQLSFSVQAVTNVRYCYFPVAEVRARVQSDPVLFELWFRLAAAEHRNADKRLVDLGQRAAQERVAALIAHVISRLEDRGEAQDDELPFPMSQQQIADCTGLTPVHTCRVLSWMRKQGICTIGHGVMKITDRAELQRLATVR